MGRAELGRRGEKRNAAGNCQTATNQRPNCRSASRWHVTWEGCTHCRHQPCSSLQLAQRGPGIRQSLGGGGCRGVDKLEDEAFRRAVDGCNARTVRDKDGNIISETSSLQRRLLALLLKDRRPETFNRPTEIISNRVDERVSLSEAQARLERLGLPMPVVEGDYKLVDDRSRNNS